MSIGSTRAICQSERMKTLRCPAYETSSPTPTSWSQEGRSIIHLELGEPDFGTPPTS